MLLTNLLDLVFIPSVSAWPIVGEWFWSSEFMIARGSGDNVAVRGDLPRESRDRSSHLVDLGEEDDTRESSFGIIRDCRVKEENAWSDLVTATNQVSLYTNACSQSQ